MLANQPIVNVIPYRWRQTRASVARKSLYVFLTYWRTRTKIYCKLLNGFEKTKMTHKISTTRYG